MPKEGTDLGKWAVIACDQFTSPNEDYWQRVEAYVGGAPSTLRLIFPEYYLTDKENIQGRVEKIHEEMKSYLDQGVLGDALGKDCFVYTRRRLSDGKTRQGLVVLMDLEAYSYKKGEKPAIRPTEGIVEERLPVRMQIRRGAPLEFPHILMLIDDPERRLIEPLGEDLEKHTKLYDFELMMNGGHAEGYAVTDLEAEKKIFEVVDGLADEKAFQVKYGLTEVEQPLVLAVGDGNHSLASAKAVWEEVKKGLVEKGLEWENSPARFAMAEIINVHDEALEFEPIHRVLFGAGEIEVFKNEMKEFYAGKGADVEIEEQPSEEMMWQKVRSEGLVFGMTLKQEEGLKFMTARVRGEVHSLTVGALQMFIDDYLQKHPEVKVDYIHGEDGVKRDASVMGNIGFFLPVMNKSDLFRAVIREGVTPRKTFSMGEAETKAYYIMGHKISEM